MQHRQTTGWRAVLIAAGALGLVLGGLVLISPPPCSIRPGNQRNASGSLKTLGTAQADFRSNDRDGNGINDFWVGDVQGLYAILGPDEEGIKLIEVTIARADQHALTEMNYADVPTTAPKAGYWYATVPIDASGHPYAGGHSERAVANRNTETFAFCTWPAAYGSSGRLTFILSEQNEMYKKDNGGKRVLQWPADPAAEGWTRMD